MLWDSHPLALGATPAQVFIDGIPQLTDAHLLEKPETFQRTPPVPNFDKEAQEAVEYEGLPPLEPVAVATRLVVFVNVRTVLAPAGSGVEELFSAADESALGTVVTENGRITCVGVCSMDVAADATVIDLQGGSISPGLVSFGSPLGLEHIAAEQSTVDGPVYDPLSKNGVPRIVGGDGAIIRAADGLLYGTRDALYVRLVPYSRCPLIRLADSRTALASRRPSSRRPRMASLVGSASRFPSAQRTSWSEAPSCRRSPPCI